MGDSMKIIVFFFIMLLLCSSSFAADQIGALCFGRDTYFARNEFFDEIGAAGFSAGLLVPVRFPDIPVHVKMKVAFHPVENSNKNENSNYYHLTNEILLGHTFPEYKNITLLPQIGLGASAERFKIEKDYGRAHVDIFIDFSLRLDYDLKYFNVGALVNFERDFNIGNGSFISPNRINLSLLVSR